MRHFCKLFIILAILASTSMAGQSKALVLVPPENREDYWILNEISNPYYPGEAARQGVEGCAAIAFVIESNGSTSSFHALASHPPGVFLQAAAAAISKWKFTPSEKNSSRQPVYTYQVIEFNLRSDSTKTGTEPGDSTGDCDSEAERAFDGAGRKAGVT